MNRESRTPLTRQENRLAAELEGWIREFFPFEIREGLEPELVLPDSIEQQLTAKAAASIAERMVSGVQVANAKTWRAAARQSLHSKRIYQALRTEMGSPIGMRVDELVAANQRLILRMPDTLMRRAQAFVHGEQRRGTRANVIAKELEARLPKAIRNQAKMFARTEVGRAETALTRARAERLGLNWYEWANSHDKRVRPSHKLMGSVLVAWIDPPAPETLAGDRSSFGRYHPGTVPNCRCLALPLIDLDEVRWPHKVYALGRIEYVSRSQFEKWVRSAAA